MPFSLDKFCKLRSHAYHLTATSNIEKIRAEGVLYPASHWITRMGDRSMLREKRPELVSLTDGDESIIIRDQAPLYEGKMELEEGVSFADFIESLNSRVYFWPGSADGPNPYGQRHADRYSDEDVVVIRIPTRDLFASNPDCQPAFCKYNSGSPRPSNGIKSPRGRNTFAPAGAASFRASQAIELTFEGAVMIPTSSEVRQPPKSRWQSIL